MVIINTISAGGIVIKFLKNEIQILIVEKDIKKNQKWFPILRQLPKGSQKKNETLEETALREVREETGYETEIIEYAGETNWTYIRSQKKYYERIFYYLMLRKSEYQNQLDKEFDRINWITLDMLDSYLSYPEEIALLKKVTPQIQQYVKEKIFR